MSSNCSACGRSIQTLYYLECCQCKNTLDLECLNINQESFNGFTDKQKDSWICPECKCSQPKANDVSTPVATLNNTFTRGVNVIRGSRIVAPITGATPSIASINAVKELDLEGNGEQVTTLSALMSEIRLLRNDILAVKNQITSVSLNFTMQNVVYEEKLEKQEKEIAFLKVALAEFKSTTAQQEQYNVRDELELVGVPEQNNENLTHIILLSSKKLGIELQAADIDEVRRVGTKQHDAGPVKNLFLDPL
ncbi:hypothetical protein O0L34_g16892 [Tuta absoluta]|nr:hypothetical protein O0L34_g16892 [Tuta absoluta]